MTDAKKRPGFERHATDDVSLSNLSPSGSSSKHGAAELYDDGSSTKGGKTDIDVKPIDGEFRRESEVVDNDGFAIVTEPVTDANDLITQVIHVDDDPTLNPYTFRMFFLGKQISPGRAPVAAFPFSGASLTPDQVLVFPSSAQSYRRSSTSSPRPSSCLWCS